MGVSASIDNDETVYGTTTSRHIDENPEIELLSGGTEPGSVGADVLFHGQDAHVPSARQR